MTTYYLDPVSGNDSNAGTSFGTAWATLQKALDSATTSGDIVVCCNTGTESTTVQIDCDTATGATDLRINFVAGDASGNIDASQTYTIRATAAMTALMAISTGANNIRFQGIKFDANGNAGIAVRNPVDLASNRFVFEDCQFCNATGDGISLHSIGTWYFYNCHVFGNGGNGHDSEASERGTSIQWIGGSNHDNGGRGFLSSRAGTVISRALIYDNSGIGVDILGNGGGTVVMYNTIHNNGSHGIAHTGASNVVVLANSITNNVGTAVAQQAGSIVDRIIPFSHNNLYGNGAETTRTGGLPASNLTADPLYTSTVDGAEDFRPQAASPLIAAALGGTTIGALGPLPSTGGGEHSYAHIG